MKQNLTGRLLIASPYLSDGHFMRSVIFIIRHDDEGAFGLTVNRPTEQRFREFVEPASDPSKDREDDYVFLGGPVSSPVLALHDLAGIGEPCGILIENSDDQPSTSGESAIQGVKHTVHDFPADPWGSMSIDLGNPPAWITGDDDHLRILLRRTDANVRYIKDYSGWGPGQLDEDLRVGGWLVGDTNSEILFGDPQESWETAVKQCGHKVLHDLAPGVEIVDPNLN